MPRRMLITEHLRKLQAGFFQPTDWLGGLISDYSIKKLVSLSIATVSGFFLLIIALFLIESLLISHNQETVKNKSFPLLDASRDLQGNLSELVVFKIELERAEGSTDVEIKESIAKMLQRIEQNLVRLKGFSEESWRLNRAYLNLKTGFTEAEVALNRLSRLKNERFETEKKLQLFQDKIQQLFNDLVVIEEGVSGKVSLISARLQRATKKGKTINKKEVGLQRKVDRQAAQIGLSLSRLGKLLVMVDASKNQEALLNLRDNELKQNLALLSKQLGAFISLSKTDRLEDEFNPDIQKMLLNVSKLHRLLLRLDDSLYAFSRLRLQQTEKFKIASEHFRSITSNISDELKLVSEISGENAAQAVERVGSVNLWGGLITFMLGVILVSILVLFLSAILRRINEPIDLLSDAMHRLSSGDVSIRLREQSALPSEFVTLWDDFNRFSDRTERLINEQEMIFDNAEVGIAWIRSRRYVKVNAKLLEIFRASEDYFVGQETRVIYSSEDDYLKLGKEGYPLLEEGKTYTAEFEMKKADGSLFWCKVSGKSTGMGGEKDSVWLHEDITERKRTEEDLYRLANHDELTGLPNRAYFAQEVELAVERAKRNNNEFAVFFVDLDRFKHINDSLGHDMGDLVLCKIAERIQNVIRASDFASRLGGDEFTVLIESFESPSDLLHIAKKINLELSRCIKTEQRELFVGGSIGISTYPRDGLVPDELLSHADAAMYAAKEMGRNNAQFYNNQIGINSNKYLELFVSLRQAIENGEFELHYQPKVALKTRKIIGMEALIRWNRPEVGLVSPFEFIPVLEESGLMSEVGSWVIEEAGRVYQQWIGLGLDPGHIAVNLSERQFNDDQLLATLNTVLKEAGMPASALELEITESLMMGDTHNATTILKEIRGRGFGISMDDFGTGYSSLAYLKRFPVDTIKIDRTFVRDIAVDEDDAAIIDAILAIACQLKLKSVAEGIETEEQLALLLEKNCEIGQGYLFSKPVPADEMAKLLRKGVL